MDFKGFKHSRIFEIFCDLAKIPHGSGDMKKIARYCADFAEEHNLRYIRDEADNVIIFKNGTLGFEKAEPIILQGHLDMVCQKTNDSKIDFSTDGITVIKDGDFLKADGTTLGADNGIAVAMILSILGSDKIPHPPIEAVFTTDEEVGMLGAIELDFKALRSKRMINIDSEEDDTLTVSCAGGSDFVVNIPVVKDNKTGTAVSMTVHSLKGGHSGVEINKGRHNADIIIGKILNDIKNSCEFNIISINGGDKANAIPNSSNVVVYTKNPVLLVETAKKAYDEIYSKISTDEPLFSVSVKNLGGREHLALNDTATQKIIEFLNTVPNGVVKMSDEIEGLVETSLNLGILRTEENSVVFHFALRSNKDKELAALQVRVKEVSKKFTNDTESFGQYPAWEYKSDSKLQTVYKKCYKAQYGKEPKVEAIHAGLECAVFASRIKGLDCISMGPNLFDVHTVNEKLSIKSTESTYELLLKILKSKV